MEMHAMGDPTHPLRHYNSIMEVPNKWDTAGQAYKVSLECGHVCYLTGHQVFNLTGVHCKQCAEDKEKT